MIDIEDEVFDRIARAVLAEHPGAYVTSSAEQVPASFPAVYLFEAVNQLDDSLEDTSNEEKGATLSYTANVYSNSMDGRKEQCRSIMAIIDREMRGLMMRRSFARPVNNAADPSIYRMVARYVGGVTKDNDHYRK